MRGIFFALSFDILYLLKFCSEYKTISYHSICSTHFLMRSPNYTPIVYIHHKNLSDNRKLFRTIKQVSFINRPSKFEQVNYRSFFAFIELAYKKIYKYIDCIKYSTILFLWRQFIYNLIQNILSVIWGIIKI